MRLALLLVLLAALPVEGGGWTHAAAQEPSGPKPVQPARPLDLPRFRPPVADTGIFSPLPLPPPSLIRRPSGSPGSGYWQQQVDYTIKVTLDTAAGRIAGTESIRYTNNSPDTLRFLWIQVDQNRFRAGSTGSLPGPEGPRARSVFQGGFEIGPVTQCVGAAGQRGSGAARRARGRGATQAAAPPCPAVTLRARVDETMMYLDLARPIPPGATTVLQLTFGFNVPGQGADRTARDGSLYQIARWYPRMAVYDDVRGWNTDPYLGQAEFYLEYGDVEYEVTLPAGYVVAGTGVLQNPADVLTQTQRTRLAAAARSDTTIQIITPAELTTGAARPASEGLLTWRFRAVNVRDVAWAASPEYLWDAAGWEGVLVQAFYREPAANTWREAARMGRYSIQEYSTRWLRYPYPQVSVVEGPASGMAYPMLAMVPGLANPADLYRAMTHEIGHMWYPIIVGSDGRRHAWMDEGFSRFITGLSEEGYWKHDPPARRQEWEMVMRLDQAPTAQPIMTSADRYQPGNLLGLVSIKPSLMLHTLRTKVLKPEVFDSAFREYTRRWAFKHPQPADFFRTIEEVSGRDLAWFWRGFFYTTAVLDQSVESVKQPAGGPAQITLANLGDAVMPVELELGFEDETAELVKLPVEIWYAGSRYVYEVDPGKGIVRAQVNPDGGFPDAVTANDVWKRPEQARTSAADERR